MTKRMWSACSLVCALLLLLSSASLAKVSDSESTSLDVRTRIGARGVEQPLPTTGTTPGDDDTPDRGGAGGDGDLNLPVTNQDGSSRGLKDLWANFRLHLLTVLRVWK